MTANIRRKFKAAEKLTNRFCVFWTYTTTEDAIIEKQARALLEKYSNVINKSIALTSSRISKDAIVEIKDLKKISFANISSSLLGPLLIKSHELHFETLFSNGYAMLCIFCTIPVSVASAEQFLISCKCKIVLIFNIPPFKFGSTSSRGPQSKKVEF